MSAGSQAGCGAFLTSRIAVPDPRQVSNNRCGWLDAFSIPEVLSMLAAMRKPKLF
jgi:hypothetical protein